MKNNNFNFNQVFLNTLDSKALEQLLSFSHLENVSAYISGKSFSILLAKASFGFLLISMLSYWFQLSFKSDMLMKSTTVQPANTNPFQRGYVRNWLGVSSFVKGNILFGLKKVPLVTMWFANITLAVLLSIRWIESGHFPLSNLYESLIFLSWSLTVIHLFLENLFYKKEQLLDNTKTLTPPASDVPCEARGVHFSGEDVKVAQRWGVAKQEGIKSRGFIDNVNRLLVMKQYPSTSQALRAFTSSNCFAQEADNATLVRLCVAKEVSVPTLTLGAITSPVALFTNAFATFSLPQEMQKVTVLVPALKSNWLIMHVSVMIISYAALLSGSLLAMAFLVVKFLNDNKIPSIVHTSINGVGYAKERFKSLLPFGLRRFATQGAFTSSLPLTSAALSASCAKQFEDVKAHRGKVLLYSTKMNSEALEGVSNSRQRYTSSRSASTYPYGVSEAEKQKSSAWTDADASFTSEALIPRRGKGSEALLVSVKQLLTPSGYTRRGSKNKIDSKLITPNPLTPSINPLLLHKEMPSSNVIPISCTPLLLSSKMKKPLRAFTPLDCFAMQSFNSTSYDFTPVNATFISPLQGKLVSTASAEGAFSSSLPLRGTIEAGKAKENKITKHFQCLDLPHILDNLSYRSIGLGFALLTIGILSGAVWANEAWGSYWSWDPKETWAFITWLVFALYLHTRLSKGWVGKESAFVASFGFVVIWFCYLGVNLFGKGLHSYGWFQQ